MAERTSTIPPKAQVPVALVLAAVFAVLLWVRFAPDASHSADKTVAVSQASYSLDEIRELIDEVRGEDVALSDENDAMAVCQGDPFLWDALEPIEPVVALPEEPNTEMEDAMAERDERLANLRLSGTMFIGQRGIAVINGQHFYTGDEIDGFTINHIDERTAVLVDEYGAEELAIAFDSLLPLQDDVGAGQ